MVIGTRILAVFLLLALSSSSSFAAIAPRPVKASLDRPTHFPVVGEEFTTGVTLKAARDATVTGLEIAGDGWDVVRWDGAATVDLKAGESVRWELRAVPGPGFGPLVVRGEVDRRPWNRSFDPSREAWGALLTAEENRVPALRVFPAMGDDVPAPARLAPAVLEALMEAEAGSPSIRAVPAPEEGATTCVITGRLKYRHDAANRYTPANGATVALYWWDPARAGWFLDDLVETQADGEFTFTLHDDVDIFFSFTARGRGAEIQDTGVWENTYAWNTGTTHIPAGRTAWDAGTIHYLTSFDALHILTDITFAHDQVRDLGFNVDHVDVQWPESDEDVSNYDPFWGEVHLARADAWQDGVICHEWGHYWHSERAHAVLLDYCNGICDDGRDCGHCGWCPEDDKVAWMEGCAQVLSRASTAYIADRVTFPVIHEGIGGIPQNTGCDWDPWNIENVFAGAVWDMIDDDTGTESNGLRHDPLGRPLYDQLDLGVADILDIMSTACDALGHEPYRATGFFTCAFEYLADLGSPDATPARLWETARDWDLELDDTNPSVPTNLTTDFPVGVPTQKSVGGFYWQASTDDLSGVCGYAVALFQDEPNLPDPEIDTTQPQWWPSGQLAPGTWYFSVVAVDRAHNWNLHMQTIGPIIITEPDPADLTPAQPSGWSAPLVVRGSLAPESPNPVLQTDTVSGTTVYFNWGEQNTGTGPSGNFHDVIFADGSPVFTSSLRYLGAGAGGSTRNMGPQNLGLTGRHTLWVRVDGEDEVDETDENDNVWAKQFVFLPERLSLGENIWNPAGLPDPAAGHDRLPGGVTPYPNGDGYDVDFFVLPDLVWAVPLAEDERLTARLFERDTGQDGFATPLYVSTSLADRPAAVLQEPVVTGRTDYCLGISGTTEAIDDYVLRREPGLAFAMPDTIETDLRGADALELFLVVNDVGEDAWFTIKLASRSEHTMTLRFFEPGYGVAGLDDADYFQTVAPGDTAAYSVFVPEQEIASVVVGRDTREHETTCYYTIFAYREKADLETWTPAGWFANLVPQNGTPYNPQDPSIPAPTTLVGGTASTGIYRAIRNRSGGAGIPFSLSDRVDLDGKLLFSTAILGPLDPLWDIKMAHGSLVTVRGGRHTLVHRINYTHGVDEDFYGNNDTGRQWVWSPASLGLFQVSTQPAPPDPDGGGYYVEGGLDAPNCDGFYVRDTHPITAPTLFAAYAVDDALDVDLGLYVNAHVTDGFSTTLAESHVPGVGAEFVLKYVPVGGEHSHYIGALLGSGLSSGDYTLATTAATTTWSDPVNHGTRGTVGAGTYVDLLHLALPPGVWQFTLESPDHPLGFSLHDMTGNAGSRTSPFDGGAAWQSPHEVGMDKRFTVTVPDPAPPRFAVVVWRPDGSTAASDARWLLRLSNAGGVEDPGSPPVTRTRLAGASPNPFGPATELALEIAEPGRCEVTVLDVRGRRVRTLLAEDLAAGRHPVRWDGRDDAGHLLPSGIYLARLTAPGGTVDLLKIALMR